MEDLRWELVVGRQPAAILCEALRASRRKEYAGRSLPLHLLIHGQDGTTLFTAISSPPLHSLAILTKAPS
jgi:hypothetical protein